MFVINTEMCMSWLLLILIVSIHGSSMKWFFIAHRTKWMLDSYMVYLADNCSYTCLWKVCLVVVIAFPHLVCLATHYTWSYWLSTLATYFACQVKLIHGTATVSFNVISKQMLLISLTYVTSTDSQQHMDKWLIPNICKCTVPTLWQVSITGTAWQM